MSFLTNVLRMNIDHLVRFIIFDIPYLIAVDIFFIIILKTVRSDRYNYIEPPKHSWYGGIQDTSYIEENVKIRLW